MIYEIETEVVSNEQVSERLFVMELKAPEIAQSAKPGQFIHINIPTLTDHILRRPFCIYYRNLGRETIALLYQVVGDGTAALRTWGRSQRVSVMGPIGNGWQIPEHAERALLVGGGVGAVPLYLLYEELVRKGIDTDVVLGAVTKDALVCASRYTQVADCEPWCATDDGSYGYEGFCTEPARDALLKAASEGLQYDFMAVCGPEPLMRACAALAAEQDVACYVSLEKRMACGIGACLSCVVDTQEGKKRVCVDGPIFDAKEIIW